MINKISRKKLRDRRAYRIRKKIKDTSDLPRLSVFRSNKHIYAQVIDDSRGETLVFSSDLKINKNKSPKDKAKAVGEQIATKCQKKKIESVVFDKGGYKYAGLVSILAEGARKKGLKF